jgi:hypothetical protein
MRLLFAFFAGTHILLAALIGNSVVLAPDEGGYAYTFKNLYGESSDPNPQFSSGWISAPKIFLFLVYLPAKVFTLLGISDLLAIRLLSVILTSIVFYGVISLASRNPRKTPDKVVSLSLGIFFIPSTFFWTTVGLREAFIIWALFLCFFGLFLYFSKQSFFNLLIIVFGFYSLLSIKSYLWAGAALALLSFFPLAFLKKISIKNLLLIVLSAAVLPVILFSATSTPYALNFIVNPDLSSAANRSGDSISVLYIDSETGKLSAEKKSENDKKVVFHGDYTAVAVNDFINTNPDATQSKLLNVLGFGNRVQQYIQSKLSSSSTKSEPSAKPSSSTKSEPSAKPSSSTKSEPSAKPSSSTKSEPSAKPSSSTKSEPSAKPSSSTKSEPSANIEINNDTGHIIKPGNLSNLASLIQPSLLFVFGNIPFMQSGESLFRTIASIESPLWWLFYSLVIFALLSYKKRNWLENPILIYSLVLTFGYIVMSAITEVNFGTAFRHRSILVIPLIFIVLATRISLQNENLKKLDNLET